MRALWTTIAALAVLALGFAGDVMRGHRRPDTARHRAGPGHRAGVALGTDAQRLNAAADTISFRPAPGNYQSGRPMYPDLGGPGDWPRTLRQEGHLW